MTFFRDLFQNLFGGNRRNEYDHQGFDDRQHYGDKFRNPIWRNDEEDSDDYVDEYRGFGQNPQEFHFQIFTNPFEMTRYFETQMQNMMKDFFNFGFNHDSVIGENFGDHHEGLPQLLPPPVQGKKNPRDEVLKPGYDLPSQDPGDLNSKRDQDLDGKITAGDFSRIWQDVEIPDEKQLVVPEDGRSVVPRSNFKFNSFGKSVMSQIIRRPDGTVEERKSVTDSEGNCETTIKRKVGDKIYTSVTKRDKNGVESKTENFENIPESEIKNFDSNWKPLEEPKIDVGPLSKFPWEKFFDFNPKL
ncbi:uncharacterized protein LOC130674744 [Microplitis mediator]|uniref:uncharacterized protein LOC130674744 n=1 Tax=Microplitis mediator TaxID=375433 RepID=UPI0025544A9F|nr:uncharacterized protein LOC130674744 [Microplitis mediator]